MVKRPEGMSLPHEGITMKSTMRYHTLSPRLYAKFLKSNATHYLRLIAAREQGEQEAVEFLRSIGHPSVM